MMGSDFGPKVDLTLKPGEDAVYGVSGTLGGYIDLMRHNGTVKKLGLTSYHCVRYGIPGWPGTEKSANNLGMNTVPEEHDLQMIDDKGLPIGSPAGRAMRFQAPSQRAHKKAVHSIDCNLETVEQHLEQSQNPKKLQQCINEYRADRERKTKYFEQGDQNLGNLFMCSGLKERTSTNGRIDVAFLNVRPGKLGSNTVPKESEWGNGFTPSMTVKRNGKKLNGIKACENEYRTLFKVGSAMGPSSGKFNSIKSDLHMSWDGKLEMSFSNEYCFVSDALRSRGVDHGDPGSFVFTYDNEWVGVVLGGSVRRMSQVTPVCYVTDAQAILDWVGKIKNKDGEHYAARLSAD